MFSFLLLCNFPELWKTLLFKKKTRIPTFQSLCIICDRFQTIQTFSSKDCHKCTWFESFVLEETWAIILSKYFSIYLSICSELTMQYSSPGVLEHKRNKTSWQQRSRDAWLDRLYKHSAHELVIVYLKEGKNGTQGSSLAASNMNKTLKHNFSTWVMR